ASGSGGGAGASPLDGADATATGIVAGFNTGEVRSANNIISNVSAFFGFFSEGIRADGPGSSNDLIFATGSAIEDNAGGAFTIDSAFHGVFSGIFPGSLIPDPGSAGINSADAALIPGDLGDVDGDGDTAEALPLDALGKGRLRKSAPDFGAFETGPDCPADLAEPFDVLDVFDVIEFLGGFDAQDPSTDLAAPAGTFDVFDVIEYLSLFDQGC
ncbi:MAG: GC-type dockerin domain-anchored protein, partial [Planctomycetota bacterium]